MFHYTVAKNADQKAFESVCVLLEVKINGMVKEKLLEDVDGTLIQIYKTGGKEITVFNDYEVGAVYIDSELNLDQIFKSVV